MKELLTYIVKNLVSEPDAIAITEEIDGDNVTYSLRVAPGDMGRVIGRHGRIAKEIRTLMKAAGNRENKRVTLFRSTQKNSGHALVRLRLKGLPRRSSVKVLVFAALRLGIKSTGSARAFAENRRRGFLFHAPDGVLS